MKGGLQVIEGGRDGSECELALALCHSVPDPRSASSAGYDEARRPSPPRSDSTWVYTNSIAISGLNSCSQSSQRNLPSRAKSLTS